VRGNGVECWLSRVQNHQRILPATKGDNYYIPHLLARQYLEILTEEMTQHRIYYKAVGGATIVALTALLLREIQEMRAFESELHQPNRRNFVGDSYEEQNPMVRAEEYIQSNLQSNLSIDKVANHLYLSRAYFTRLFRAHTGKSFVEYVTQCRVEEAKVLLRSTEWPVNRVGERVGLKPSRFRAIFQESIGISPTEFRKRIREEHFRVENVSNAGT
jgi:AraC-like DNA-binding protein